MRKVRFQFSREPKLYRNSPQFSIAIRCHESVIEDFTHDSFPLDEGVDEKTKKKNLC